MGQFYTDFSDSPTLTERWHTGDGAVTVETSSLPTGSGTHVAKIVMSAGGRYAVSWDEVGTPSGDVEVLLKWQVENTPDGNAGRAIVHGSGDSSSETGYFANHNVFGSSTFVFGLIKYDSAASTTLATGNDNLSEDTWYWTRVQRTGTTIRRRTWADGGSEPGTWSFSATDAALSSGWIGFGASTSGQVMWVDEMGVGTGGDAAPDTYVAQDITLNHLGPTTALYEMAVTPPTQTVSMQAIGPTAQVHQMTVIGDQTISLNHLGQTSQLYGLTVSPDQDVTLNHLGPTAQLYEAAVAFPAQAVTLNHIAATTALYQLAVSPGAVTVILAHLGPSSEVFDAGLVYTQTITLAHLGPTSQVFAPQRIKKIIILAPLAPGGPPEFALVVTGPLPDGAFVARQRLPADLALSFGSQLPGGWASLSAGVLDDTLRRVLSATEVQAMVLPYPVEAPPFAHVELLEAGTGRVWEGRRSAVDDVGGEIRGIEAVGYGITGLRDQPMPGGRGAVRSDVLVRAAIAQAAPLIELLEVEDPGVLRDWREFAGRWPHDVLSTLTGAGNGAVAFTWTVYDRQLRFFALTPPSTPHYQVPADGTVRRRLGSDEIYTALTMSYTDLDGRRRSTGTLRDEFAIAKYGIERVYPIPDGGTMTPAAALAFARTELAKRTQEGVAVSITRDWTRGVETSWGSQTPVWRVQAGEWLQVADEAMQPITAVSYDAQAGSGTVTLGQPVATSAAAEWRRMQETIAAVRGGRNPVTGAAS